MTQDEIIRMAREAGLHRHQHNLMSNPMQIRFSYDGYEENLVRFAALVAANEREKQAEQEPVAWWDGKETAFFEHELCGLKAPAEFHIPLYTAPVRTKDLTDDEILDVCRGYPDSGILLNARAVIAADREKNSHEKTN